VTLPALLRARGLFGPRAVAMLKLDVEHHEAAVRVRVRVRVRVS